MKRRGFVAALAVLAGGPALAALLRQRSRVGLRQRLPELLPDSTSAERVGLEYLALAPAERDASVLRDLVLSDLGWRAWLAQDLAPLVRQRIRRDFAGGQVVHLRGWLLSRTEARLCALRALDARG